MNNTDRNNNSTSRDDTSSILKMRDLQIIKQDNNTDDKNLIENLNSNLRLSIENDLLFHLNLSTLKINFKATFGDVKFICMGGSAMRMKTFAHRVKDYIAYEMPFGQTFENISESADRYAMFKIGPVLSLSHGMGCGSISILLNEILKLVYYADCKNVTFFRLGTCGGIGLEPGTIVVTEEAVDGLFRAEYKQFILGEEVARKTKLNENLVKELLEMGQSMHQSIVSGKTMCCNDFYEEQGRLDGIFCSYDEKAKMNYLLKCHENGVLNIEMESACFASFCNHAGINAAIVCVTLLDRLKGDSPNLTKDTYIEFQERPIKLVCEYIRQHLAISNGF